MHFLNKIKNYIVILIMSLTLTAPSLAFAAGTVDIPNCTDPQTCAQSGSCQASSQSSSECSSNQNGSGLAKVAQTIVNVLSFIVGLVAVVMLIYGGFRYITSGGESQAVGNAKNTIIYAIVGLLLVVFAQVIVHFVLNTASSAQTG